MERTGAAARRGRDMKPAVFIDRDGTINEQMGYINHLSRFILLPGVSDAIRLLNKNEYLAIVITNQSGVARGYFPIELVEKINKYMEEMLFRQGAMLDGILYCPHYPSAPVKEYSKVCRCRKPDTGLIEKAKEMFDIDMSNSWVVGDSMSDIKMAKRAGLRSILVRTGYGRGEIEYVLPKKGIRPEHISDDLLNAVKFILNHRGGAA